MTHTDRHLTDIEVVAAVEMAAELPAEVDDHLRRCDACREDVEVVRSLPDTAAGSTLRVATAEADASPPRRGDLWRVTNGGVADLAFVWSSPRPWVRVFPASTDTAYSDDRTVAVGPEDNSLALPLGIWCGLGFDLALDLFDRKMAVVTMQAVEAVQAVHRSVPRDEPLEGAAVGAPITSLLDDRFEYRAALAERFTALADTMLDDADDEVPDQYAANAATHARRLHGGR